ncbi:hypothetical protein MesoLjLb_63070 [Mesorhizobium sp. L-8-3]|nr:hypothetical protein MesoLjLb_63070 [Mesorhizobium sp. L-8-3]
MGQNAACEGHAVTVYRRLQNSGRVVDPEAALLHPIDHSGSLQPRLPGRKARVRIDRQIVNQCLGGEIVQPLDARA